MKNLGYAGTVKLSFLLVLVLWTASFSQTHDDSTDSRGYWLSLGIGGGSGGGALSGGLSCEAGPGLVTLRYVHNEEFDLLGPSPAESVHEFGILYGIMRKSPIGHIAFSGGIGFVGGVRRGRLLAREFLSSKYERQTYQAIGAAFDYEAVWTPVSFLGIGLNIPANLNSEQSFIAFQLNLQLGSLR